MSSLPLRLGSLAGAALLLPSAAALAQQAAAVPPPPATSAAAPASNPMATPSMGASLSANPNPTAFDIGPLGKIYVTGALTGLALFQDHVDPGDHGARADLSNAQLFVQKTDGLVQFFVQAGAYSLPALGTPYVKAVSETQDTYGVVPQAYLKFAPTASFNVEIGKLPTLIGAETTFTFENPNIERGLLWNQENAVNRGVQANYNKGPLTVSVSLNDGFYSNRFNWVSGLLTWTFNPRDSLTIDAGGNFDRTTRSTFATPLAQNNGQIYNLIFTHAQGPFSITSYVQYTYVPAAPQVGIPASASTIGGAVIAKYSLTPTFSVSGRAEYISASGGGGQVNLLYGPGSGAWSLTLTPTWQYKILFVRGELSYTRAGAMTPGFAFGPTFADRDQTRGLIEAGVLF